MKTKFSITLDGWDAVVLAEALAIELKASGERGALLHWPNLSEAEIFRRRNRLVRFAISAVCAAMVQRGETPTPFGVELTPEDDRITKMRLEYTDGPSGLSENEWPGDASGPRFLIE